MSKKNKTIKVKKTKKKNKKSLKNHKNNCYKILSPYFEDYNILDPNKNINELILNITNIFNINNDILNKNYNFKSNKILFNICSPPKKYKKKGYKLISLLKKKDIVLNNHYNGKFRILWTGWEQLSQLVACYIANYISLYYNESRAIEQTNFTKKWVKKCGTWENEYRIIKNLLYKNNPILKELDCSNLTINEIFLNIYNKNNEKNNLNNIITDNKKCGEYILDSSVIDILKRIWDKYSLEFSKYNKLQNTIIVIPDKLDNEILNKTLVKIELENLNTKKICLIMFQETGNIIINPHLNGYNTNKQNKIIFQFNNWNKDSKKLIIDFLKKYRGKKFP